MMYGCSAEKTRSLEPKQPNPRVVGVIGSAEEERKLYAKEKKETRLSKDDRGCVFPTVAAASTVERRLGEFER